MTRRITVPADHVAVILPGQLADELMSLLQNLRRKSAKQYEFYINYNSDDPQPQALIDKWSEQARQHVIAGNVMLALLEARES